MPACTLCGGFRSELSMAGRPFLSVPGAGLFAFAIGMPALRPSGVAPTQRPSVVFCALLIVTPR